MSEEKKKALPEKKKTFWERELDDLRSLDLLRASLAEFLGVMFLVLYGVGAGLYHETLGTKPSSVHISIETGFFIAVIITTLSTVSGGHVNPAISIGFLVTGGITVCRFLFYMCFQVLGAIAGMGIITLVSPVEMQHGSFGVILPGPNVTDVQAFVCETYITFLLDFATFSFLDSGRSDMTGSVPFIIGILVVINVFSTWNLSGGCMNPARNFGPMVINAAYDKAWVYWAGPMIGGALGAFIYDRVFSTRVCKNILHGCNSQERKDLDISKEIRVNEAFTIENSKL
ncbi:aquaporin-like [Saccostrea echinata]|uniref:aquaporin-like n=1 Tax=Saccostrea echinata TaxID=191078 RepID=UPI002A7F41A9|nr:aquaporin-like [Saccostrea echinata]XP_061194300.1 aquaporin-like [Saccostrea echinata]